MQWPQALRRLSEPWASLYEASVLVGPTPEGMCLVLADEAEVALSNSLYVAVQLLRAARLTHPGATGVVVVDRTRYQPLVERTVELVGVRSIAPTTWNSVANPIPTGQD